MQGLGKANVELLEEQDGSAEACRKVRRALAGGEGIQDLGESSGHLYEEANGRK